MAPLFSYCPPLSPWLSGTSTSGLGSGPGSRHPSINIGTPSRSGTGPYVILWEGLYRACTFSVHMVCLHVCACVWCILLWLCICAGPWTNMSHEEQNVQVYVQMSVEGGRLACRAELTPHSYQLSIRAALVGRSPANFSHPHTPSFLSLSTAKSSQTPLLNHK